MPLTNKTIKITINSLLSPPRDKELEYKVKKLKYKTLQPRIKNNFQFQLVKTVNHPGSVKMKFYSSFN